MLVLRPRRRPATATVRCTNRTYQSGAQASACDALLSVRQRTLLAIASVERRQIDRDAMRHSQGRPESIKLVSLVEIEAEREGTRPNSSAPQAELHIANHVTHRVGLRQYVDNATLATEGRPHDGVVESHWNDDASKGNAPF